MIARLEMRGSGPKGPLVGLAMREKRNSSYQPEPAIFRRHTYGSPTMAGFRARTLTLLLGESYNAPG